LLTGSLLRGVVEHVLVAVDRQPLGVALERPAVIWRAASASDTVVCTPAPAAAPREAVGLDQRRILEAAFLVGLDDHRELVARQRVVARDERVVAVVARVGAQLRRAGIEIADLQARLTASRRRRARRDARSRRARSARREAVEHDHRRRAACRRLRAPRAGCARRLALTPVYESSTGSSSRFVKISTATPMLAVSASSRMTGMSITISTGEADGVGQQRGQPRDEQSTERVTRRHELARAAPDVLHDPVHLLGAVRHADREHQERDQDGEWIELEAQQRHEPELPDDGDEASRRSPARCCARNGCTRR
jgi:hypothetical protein